MCARHTNGYSGLQVLLGSCTSTSQCAHIEIENENEIGIAGYKRTHTQRETHTQWCAELACEGLKCSDFLNCCAAGKHFPFIWFKCFSTLWNGKRHKPSIFRIKIFIFSHRQFLAGMLCGSDLASPTHKTTLPRCCPPVRFESNWIELTVCSECAQNEPNQSSALRHLCACVYLITRIQPVCTKAFAAYGILHGFELYI